MQKVLLSDIISSVTPRYNEDGSVKEESIVTQLQSISFPIKVSYRIKRIVDKLEPIIKAYNDKRNELIKEFGELQADKTTIKIVDPAKYNLFSEKLNELLTTEEEIDFEKISIEQVGDIDIPVKLLVNFIFE